MSAGNLIFTFEFNEEENGRTYVCCFGKRTWTDEYGNVHTEKYPELGVDTANSRGETHLSRRIQELDGISITRQYGGKAEKEL